MRCAPLPSTSIPSSSYSSFLGHLRTHHLCSELQTPPFFARSHPIHPPPSNPILASTRIHTNVNNPLHISSRSIWCAFSLRLLPRFENSLSYLCACVLRYPIRVSVSFDVCPVPNVCSLPACLDCPSACLPVRILSLFALSFRVRRLACPVAHTLVL